MESIVESPFKSISILYRKSHIWLNEACAGCGLTAAQAVVILIVCDFKVLTQDDITKRLGMDKSVIAKTVTKLLDAGFVTRTTNPKDKRTYDIQPTDKAWNVYPFVSEQLEICFQRMTSQMSPQQREAFKQLLLLAGETAINLDE